VHPGFSKRVILPIKRIFIPTVKAERSIPIPDWRQFVIGKSRKLTAREEKRRCLLFWYKETLIGGLQGGGRIVAKWSYVNKSINVIVVKKVWGSAYAIT
jgi:hypothetical protein